LPWSWPSLLRARLRGLGPGDVRQRRLEKAPGEALVQRHAGEPFALVGVNTDDDKDDYRRNVAKHGVTWRSAWEGSTRGPLTSLWGIDSFPTIFVLDAQHVLRHVNPRGEELGRVVGELLAELREQPR
jgi:hypothetical protein